MKNRISDLELLDVYREHYRGKISLGWFYSIFGLVFILLFWVVYDTLSISMRIFFSIFLFILFIIIIHGILDIIEARKKLGRNSKGDCVLFDVN